MTANRFNMMCVEKANEKQVKECLTLIKKRNDFKTTFFGDSCYDEFGNLIKGTKDYLDSIEHYLNMLKENNYEFNVGYKPSRNDNEGTSRLYAHGNRVSQQGLIKSVKNYITQGLYYDYDIVNCEPTLLLEYIERNNIDGCSTSYLKSYINNRDEILADNELEKFDIIKAINRDLNYRTGKVWLDKFNKEIAIIKDTIIAEMEFNLVEGKNYKSKAIGNELRKEERIIVDELIEFIGKENVSVPMFDGVNTTTKCNIEEFTTMIKEKRGYKYLKLIEKPIDCIEPLDIDVEDDIEFEPYEIVKERWEKEIFKTIIPNSYWRTHGDKTFQISRGDLCDYAKEFKYSYYVEKKLKITNIWDKWLEDTTKRQYTNVDFIPFSTEVYNGNSDIFNLATPYKVHRFENKETVNIDNFKMLIENLANYDEMKTNYLRNLLGFKLKYPERMCEILLMMVGHTGTGKSTIWEIMGKIMFDGSVSSVNDLDQIIGNSCSLSMLKSTIVITEEIDFGNMKKHINKMKDITTNPIINIKEKYEKPINITNTKLYVINSQNDLYIENNCRRSVLYEPSAKLKKELGEENKAYWKQLYKDMNNEDWLYSVYEYLLDNLDNDYTPSNAIDTVLDERIQEAKEYSLPASIRFILDITGIDELTHQGETARDKYKLYGEWSMKDKTDDFIFTIKVNKLREVWDLYFENSKSPPSFNIFPQVIGKYDGFTKKIKKEKGKQFTVYIFEKYFNETIRKILNLEH